jgi:NAD-dependent deacetylase
VAAGGPGAELTAAVRLAELIEQAETVVALTGAGISVPSGIPDFRTPGTGLWANVDPLEVAHIDVFRRDPRRFWSFYGDRFDSLQEKLPNRAHEVLAEFERDGALAAVITQNIDRLHARAGSTELVEVHGTIAHSSCLHCGDRHELDEVRRRRREDVEGIPRCDCGRPLKPDVVLFGEYLPAEALARAGELAAAADLMLCIGTSLEVYPVAQLPDVTLSRGGRIAILTQGPTRLDGRATVKLDGDIVAELGAVSAALRRC